MARKKVKNSKIWPRNNARGAGGYYIDYEEGGGWCDCVTTTKTSTFKKDLPITQ